jgi:hypothetical protein
MRSVIHLPVNTTSQFNRGTTGVVRSAPDPVSIFPGNQQLTVNWTKDLLGQGYRIFYSTSTITDYTLATRITITDNDTDSYTIEDLDNGVTYYVRIVTVNGAGYSVLTTEVSAVPSTYSNSKSCRMDGATEYLENTTSTLLDLGKTDPLSISFWVKWDVGEMAGDRTFMGNLNTGANYEGIEFHKTGASDLRIYLSKVFASDRIICTWGGALTENVWQHVCVIYDGSNAGTGFTCYVNGVLKVRSINQAGPISGTMNSWGNLTVGAREDGTKKFIGYLDELAVYDVALTVDQVLEIYNSGAPNKLDSNTSGPDLLAWYRCGDVDDSNYVYNSINPGTHDLDTVNIDVSNYTTEVP